MNNASLLLNAARTTTSTHATSVTPSSAAPSTSSAADASASQKSFDRAMDAARATTPSHKASDVQHDSHASHTQAKSSGKHDDDSAPKAASDKKSDDTASKADDDADKKDASTTDGDDTSLAASMLALIGVPTQVTQLAGKALGAAKAVATGNPADALAALTGAVKGDPANAAAGAKEGGLNPLATAAAEATATTASPFAALLAGQAPAAGATKDDTKGVDLAAAGPMPFAHAHAAEALNGPAQLQSTQAATSPQFSQELGEQIAWMSSAAGDIKEARIKLHPEELGSMDVRVNVDGGKVNVAIMAQHPAAVHAVQQTLSNLDSLLAHHGLSLGQAEVNQGSAQQNGGNQGQGQGGNAGQADTGAGDTLVTAATSRVSRGLVDEVA